MGLRLAEIAEHVAGKLEGDGTLEVREVAPLEKAGPHSLAWLASAEIKARLSGTKAGAVLLPLECDAPPGPSLIRVADPDVAMCEVLRMLGPLPIRLTPGRAPTSTVSASATVDGAAVSYGAYVGPNAVVGPGTQLYPGVFVGANARIGRDCVLWPNVVVREGVIIGDRVIIHPNSTIGADGFGYLQRDGRHIKIPQVGTVVIEDDVEIGANCAIDRARSGETRVRRGTKIDNLVQIGHNVLIDEHCIIVAQCGISGSVTLGHHVMLGGQVGVVDHVRIGDMALIGARGVARRDVPDGARLAGDPPLSIFEDQRRNVLVKRLPDTVNELRELKKRVAKLESAAND